MKGPSAIATGVLAERYYVAECNSIASQTTGEDIMTQEREDEIRERAYALWERAGSPSTHSQDFWRKAERELAEEKGLDVSREASSVKQPPVPSGTLAR